MPPRHGRALFGLSHGGSDKQPLHDSLRVCLDGASPASSRQTWSSLRLLTLLNILLKNRRRVENPRRKDVPWPPPIMFYRRSRPTFQDALGPTRDCRGGYQPTALSDNLTMARLLILSARQSPPHLPIFRLVDHKNGVMNIQYAIYSYKGLRIRTAQYRKVLQAKPLSKTQKVLQEKMIYVYVYEYISDSH